MSVSTRQKDEQALCQQCGICCDGTLFNGVQLKAGDSPAALRELGLSVRKNTAGWKLRQPCHALEGCRCLVYKDRPSHCREFRCLLLDEMKAGTVSPPQALRVIRRARRWADTAKSLLNDLGEDDTKAPLKLRAQRVMNRFERRRNTDQERRAVGELTQVIHQLHFLLSTRFYH